MEAQQLATEIVRKLVEEGYVAYFAGGWVRDFMMGHPSDDIDIATNAPPNVVLDLFPRTIAVGISFGVVVVLSGGHAFEVATFRRDISYKNGRTPHEIELSTPYEDAQRRDFTINGMFYDPVAHVTHDFVQGAEDIQKKIIRTIGNPHERFYEDRLRMIRAVRFAARFEFAIDSETHEAIRANAQTLFPSVALERIWQEFVKMSKFPHFEAAVLELHRLELLQEIFPSLREIHLNRDQKAGGLLPSNSQGNARDLVYHAAIPLYPSADAGTALPWAETQRSRNQTRSISGEMPPPCPRRRGPAAG